MPEFIDLSHAIEDGMQAYPGLPAPRIGHFVTHEESRARYQGKAEFLLGKYELPGNCGTYIDSPFHRWVEGDDLGAIPLASIAGLPGIVIDAPEAAGVVPLACDAEELRGRAVLIRTGWYRRWGTAEYWAPGPYVAAPVLDLLIQSGAALVGVDFWNIDDTNDPERPAHTRLLARGIPIVENLANLHALPRGRFRFYAVPPPLMRGASFPVRAFAEIR